MRSSTRTSGATTASPSWRASSPASRSSRPGPTCKPSPDRIDGAPEYPYQRFDFQILLTPFLEQFVGDVRPALMLLMGAVAVVLLIACVIVRTCSWRRP